MFVTRNENISANEKADELTRKASSKTFVGLEPAIVSTEFDNEIESQKKSSIICARISENLYLNV